MIIMIRSTQTPLSDLLQQQVPGYFGSYRCSQVDFLLGFFFQVTVNSVRGGSTFPVYALVIEKFCRAL